MRGRGLLILVVLLAASLGYNLRPWLSHPDAEPRTVMPRGDLAQDEQTTISIFSHASPSVVFITTTEQLLDPWTRRVYKTRQGTGSGFIWDEDGDVVTNYHVIKGANSARIRLADGRAYEAVLVGASAEHDLAVLRINVPFNAPPPVPVGSSADLKVGQKVFAIGNPFGLDYTLTTGVISALNRSINEDSRHEIHHLIQTDAAINPGNSGGPLLDSSGRLIGINTAIYSPSGAYAGIGFAIPVDTVNKLVPQLIAYGKTIQPWLGVDTDARVTEVILRQLAVDGVLILKVEPGSPAEQAGLHATRLNWDGSVIPGDIIQSVNDKPVHNMSELHEVIGSHRVGDRIRLGIWRAGKHIEVGLQLTAPPQM
ncbi:MAG: trypsin-like peptidase domain-containing protein [Mariprofundus sp.]|nr:trypsin-like peptidase domain-containing protein [Mariprofundus sp.]